MNEVSENTEVKIITIDNGEDKSARLDIEIGFESNFQEDTNDMTKAIKSSLNEPLNYPIDDELLADDEKSLRVYSNVVGDSVEDRNNSSLGVRTVESNEISSVSNLVDQNNEINPIKRHSTSIELTAMTSVRTGEDGVPVISFSFLQNDEKILSSSQQDNILYDFPKNSRVSCALELPENLESTACEHRLDLYDFPKSHRISAKPQKNYDNTIIKKCDSEENLDELYDIPKEKNVELKTEFSECQLNSKNSTSLTFPVDFERKEQEEQECYSDPETNCKSREKRRYKFGRAWGRMRSWLRDEKIRINEVVQRHARMQAVGVNLKSDIDKSSSRCGSYDLVEARAKVFGDSEVDNMELPSVSEEVDVPESEEQADDGASGRLRKMKSSENVGRKIMPVSFSLDKLCDESDERRDSEADEKDRHWGRGGLIKRRMLGSIRGLMASTHLLHQYDADETGAGGFEDVRRYVKQGGDFCKELAAILHERAELEASYAKGLSKLSSKLTKACAKDQGGNSSGGVNEAWRNVGEEMEAAAEAHRIWGIALSEQLAKPLRVGVAEAQGRSRKSIESSVDKASKSLQEWRGMAAKSKKQSFACARENERLQDLARIQSISQSQQNNNKASSHHMTEKEVTKLENRRRKAEDSSRRADTEFYTVSVRAERARLEYECTVRRGAKQMELLEEERLSALKDFANVYLSHLQALAPRLQQSADRLSLPVRNCSVSQDVDILKNLIRRLDNNETPNVEQLLPDFYAEHVTLAMNRERRKQALIRVLHLITQDLDREKKGREGLETLHRAFIQTPAFAADESTQNVTDKLVHMRSMLTYLEAARYKIGGALAEIEGGKKGKHPLAEHILVSRDKQGLQQSVLKVPLWAKNETFELPDDDDFYLHLTKDERNDWVDRTAGDGNSENPPDEEDFSDFDGFSSQSEDNNNQEVDGDLVEKGERVERCRALYQYSANLNDELSLNPGDLITIHQKQEDGWWIGECGGRTGIFPATYVQVLH